MKTRFICAAVEALIKTGAIEESELELYRFGMNQLVVFLLNAVTTVAIGTVFGMLWQSLLFSAAYIPLRRYAGGYHAANPRRCYALSILLIVCVLIIIRCVPLKMPNLVVLMAISAIIIFLKAPIESVNKPLSKVEISLYRKKSRAILLIEITAALITGAFFMEAAVCIGMAVLCSAWMLAVSIMVHGKLFRMAH